MRGSLTDCNRYNVRLCTHLIYISPNTMAAMTAMTSSFVGSRPVVASRPAQKGRASALVVRAGKYDEELQQTAVSRDTPHA